MGGRDVNRFGGVQRINSNAVKRSAEYERVRVVLELPEEA